ncbi:lipopolysaccharide biosynthesis protein [Rossellomorea yichunensis]|jgi:O-antigen/teichoic acid export membrane protein|uniref:lipopolysaccharide biosynthesis protein n=1 Tax=Rossellomorea yichunensis TaxID=3077331 RepID=UPI0028DE0AB3|nr:oligosaccharide flippase family protein [Rossellomorea sp. YC4-1]MDT9026822.1 oligosaccharide flippase family protein [Rossellomorea sp. YC4-1]
MKDSLIKKFLKFSYGSWVGIILGVFNTMLATRLLQPDAFGKASMFDLFIQVGMILAIFGTDQAFVRLFYEEQSNKRGALLYNCLRIPIIIAIVMIGFVIIFYQPISLFLFGKESLSLAFIISIGILTQLLFRFGQLVIRMQQKGNLYSLLQIFQKLFNIILILIFFWLLGSTFEVLIFSKFLALLLVASIAIYFGKQYWSISNLKIRNVEHSRKEILKLSAPFVLTTFISWLFEGFDKIALRHWSTFDELGLYSASMRLVALVLVLGTTFSTFWTPVAYERFKHQPEKKEFFRYISIIVSFAMFFVAIVCIAAKDLIVILLGSDYQSAAKIMPFLVFMPILYTISETTVMGINFYKKVNWHILIAGIACGINILGNWLLVPNFGAIGASVATAFSYIIFFTLRTSISLRFFKVKYPLVRIYTMIIISSVYSTGTIINGSFWGNILLGLISLSVLVLIFYKDLIYIIKNRRVLLDS